MVDLIQERKQELAEICGRYHVLRLALFGSAARADFQQETSDLDFLVEFFPMQPQEHANAYFGLARELERLFRRSVDLVEASAVHNPYICAISKPRRFPSMQRDQKAYLWDILNSISLIQIYRATKFGRLLKRCNAAVGGRAPVGDYR